MNNIVTIKERIRSLVREQYSIGKVNSDSHTKNISDFAQLASKEFSRILKGDRLKIGVSQKIINLYLKYLWCFGKISEPPHCPFDRNIISKLNLVNPPNWTKIDDIEIYKTLVKKAQEKAGDQQPIALWELKMFKRR